MHALKKVCVVDACARLLMVEGVMIDLEICWAQMHALSTIVALDSLYYTFRPHGSTFDIALVAP